MLPPSTLLGSIRDEDRWSETRETDLLSGVQAIAQALLDQRRDDRAARIGSAGFASGYPGSPLAGLDKELQRRQSDLGAAGVVFQPGLNEELAATAVWGAQLAHLQRGASVDGVLGLWFGKNPGLDRAADALRHANICGVGPASGAIAVVGDDPACKSSTLPSAAERTLAGLNIPALAPASVQDVLDLGRHALRLSRAAGLWCALKVAADVADASATILDRGLLPPVLRLVEHTPSAHLLGAPAVEMERSLVERRLPAAIAYAREHGLNPTVISGAQDEVGLLAAGSSYAELCRALADLRLGERELMALGVRVLKIGMPWPLDVDALRAFAHGLRTLVVFEDKLPLLETEAKAALHGFADAPRVVGKRDAKGELLLASHGALDADAIALALGRVLGSRLAADTPASRRLAGLAEGLPAASLRAARKPFFCSGCPHSTSTAAAPDALVGAGIGCHVMLVQEPSHSGKRGGEVVGLTQMGGEGGQWIGMAPFVRIKHFTQNLGDGTFHHSGSLALRAAVAAKVNITFKLLYNDAVAMTGGQPVEGMIAIPELTRLLQAEGVARVAITTDRPRRYRRVRLAAGTKVYDRSKMAEVERELAAVRGVTVIVHDQMCAATRRRLRRRGRLADPPQRAWINERVCEGCGDCAKQSGCLSVEPVRTEFGRKTRIDQDSCNKDMSCLRGDCPSFLTVAPVVSSRRAQPPPTSLPLPSAQPSSSATIRMVGVGGAGVVTAAHTLALAAQIEGQPACVLDQTGLSQKAGSVISDVRIGDAAVGQGTPRAARGTADVLIGFDLLGAADPRFIAACDPQRTIAILSVSQSPTGETVLNPGIDVPDRDRLVGEVKRSTAALPVLADARLIAQRAFGDAMQANMVLLGAAWQLGALPVGWQSLCDAVERGGAATECSLMALAWGRALVAAPAAVAQLIGAETSPPQPSPAALAQVRLRALPTEAHHVIALRVDDLRAHSGKRVARAYLDRLERVATAECGRTPGHFELTESAARQLHKLLAYKDEYEVARLHLLPQERQRREREFGAGAKWWLHLHPPLLRAAGVSRKIRLGRWSLPLLYVLRAGRRLRGTPLDPFGRTRVRRTERALPGEYLALLEQALELLDQTTHSQVIALSELAEQIRGYEQIKLASVERWRVSTADAMEQLRAARLA